MTNRIKELAHEVFSFKYKTSPYELNPGHRMDHLHKFAELIVKAVFARIEEERYDVYEPVKEAVMKHFGVKQ